jgi:hypothetical protein
MLYEMHSRISNVFEAFRNGKNGADDIFSTKRMPENITVRCLHQFAHPAAGLVASIFR